MENNYLSTNVALTSQKIDTNNSGSLSTVVG